MTETFNQRLQERLKRMEDAKTPKDLAYTIWSKGLEEAMGSSRDPYRIPFINWIESFKNKETPKEWFKYTTPEQLAEAVWVKKLEIDEDDKIWFGSLREGLVNWIKNYCSK